jgi:hypothetical protein
MRLALFALASLSLLACSVRTTETDPAPADDGAMKLPAPADPPPAKTPAKSEPVSQPAADTTGFAEVVTVQMRDRLHQLWFCTGTLLAKDRVITAAHCLDTDKFVSYEVLAQNAAGKPRVSASKPRVFGGTFEDPANPDIGWLTLDTPILLPAYAELTDVVAHVEAGEGVIATAVVRTDKVPTAPFFVESPMPVTSTVQYGYEHGFGTPMFSKGGDSGAGLFLVENGQRTRKLIGVARQPEPERDLDHFTRIDPAFLAWYAE